MNLLHLKYALEVERTGSITQAAESLYMGQPNLSRALKELENTYGIVIFQRTSRGVVPTERGREFLASARQVVKQVEEMERKYRPGNSDYQSFSISVPRASYISQAFSAFVAALTSAPALELDFMETNSMLAISNVLEGKTNLAIIRYQMSYENYFLRFLEDKGLGHDVFWEFRYLALLSRSHPLASRSEISAEDLRDLHGNHPWRPVYSLFISGQALHRRTVGQAHPYLRTRQSVRFVDPSYQCLHLRLSHAGDLPSTLRFGAAALFLQHRNV